MLEKEIKVNSIITKSNLPVSDYSVNPYIGCPHACKYCYASFMKRFTGHTEPWGEFLDIKNWAKIVNPQKYSGKDFFIGSVTDPYGPQEEKYKKTRQFLMELQGVDAKISIQTKSDLVLRDIDLIKTFQNIRIGFSINTLDERFKDDMDKAVSIERRINAMKILHDNGIRTACFISPIFPEITDIEAIIDKVKDKCNLIWLENLNLRGDYKAVIMDYIKNTHPNLYPLYVDIYNKGNRKYWEDLDKKIREYARENGLNYIVNDDTLSKPFNVPPTIVNFFYHSEIKKSAQKQTK